ncbi:hypothetical protein [Methylobacterium nodulans]|uniref:Lipoprotein n=1 Tax=Methylobacterium nodulans (strain LMG 21967 / CNCM I-2342 / ORS 2060) TaxID=460265 RepID=B8ID51_METNO|nr:hypothetical protein [Methylobacterium nodulans]ACL59443.1 conserved hypothetical protein [Methylobacterium nodulans ORS 2060]
MRAHSLLRLLACATALAAGCAAGALEARAGDPTVRRPRLCPQDAPPGVRLPNRAECREAAPSPAKAPKAPGFIDLGNGTQLRISGRAGFEVGIRP